MTDAKVSWCSRTARISLPWLCVRCSVMIPLGALWDQPPADLRCRGSA